MKQRTLSIAAAALLLVSSGAVSAAWQCGYDVPDCVTVTLEARQVWIESNCGYPNAIQVVVENGGGGGVSVIPNGFGNHYLGPPIDTDSRNSAYYADFSCCEGREFTTRYSCQPDQRPTGVVKGE